MQRTRQLFQQSEPAQPDRTAAFRAMCQDASEELRCDLVSIWLFDAARQKITCQASFDQRTGAISSGEILLRRDFPNYFSNLLEETFIKAPNARQHSSTRELTATYFEPHGVLALLDYILHDGATPIGVICCESRSPVREWTDAQTGYLLKLTALAACYFRRTSDDSARPPSAKADAPSK